MQRAVALREASKECGPTVPHIGLEARCRGGETCAPAQRRSLLLLRTEKNTHTLRSSASQKEVRAQARYDAQCAELRKDMKRVPVPDRLYLGLEAEGSSACREPAWSPRIRPAAHINLHAQPVSSLSRRSSRFPAQIGATRPSASMTSQIGATRPPASTAGPLTTPVWPFK